MENNSREGILMLIDRHWHIRHVKSGRILLQSSHCAYTQAKVGTLKGKITRKSISIEVSVAF